MSAVNLLSPILTGGIQNVNFVNGRVLTSGDLTAERTANLQRQQLLGQSLGAGVANGLQVTVSSSSVAFGQQVVHVAAGLAINLNGDLLQLTAGTDVALTPAATATTANTGLFTVCQPPETQLSNPGVYVFTILPASGYQGQAPVVQLSSSGVAQTCTSQYATAGVQFRLLQLTLDSTSSLQAGLISLASQIQSGISNNASAASLAPMLSQFRNGLAYASFGAEQLSQEAANPLDFLSATSSLSNYGLLDQARTAKLLTACEVPLALIYWTPNGIQFVDIWAARRRLTRDDRRVSEAEAMLFQFEDHMQSLLADPNGPAAIDVDQYFFYLPPGGMVQSTGSGITAVNSSAALTGFDPATFFGAHASKDIATTNGNLLRGLFRDALYTEPFQLTSTGEIQLYLVWENLQSVNAGGSGPLAIVFAGPALKYRGIPRFGTAKWSLSRFAPHVI